MLAVINWYVRCRREVDSFLRDASIVSQRPSVPSELKRAAAPRPRRAKAANAAGTGENEAGLGSQLSSLEQELHMLLMDASGKTPQPKRRETVVLTPRTIPRDTETPRCPPTHFSTPTTRAKDLMTKNVTELTNDEVAIVLLAKFSR